MKLSTRLGIIAGCTVLGLVVIAGFALHAVRTSLLEERSASLRLGLQQAGNLIAYYQSLEQSGKLSRGDAQKRAMETIGQWRSGDDYFFIRTIDTDIMLVHPDKSRVGKHDLGSKMPDGRTTSQVYKDALATTQMAVVDSMAKKPSTNVQSPKLNAVMRFDPWNWIVGTGAFVDDIDKAFWHYALNFLGIGIVVLVVVIALAADISRRIYRQLGGEPAYAAEVATAIAEGNLSQRVPTNARPESLLGAMSRMQANLRRMIEDIQRGASQLGESARSLTEQAEHIDQAAKDSSDATTATAASIEQMTVSVDQISLNARETERNSAQSAELAAEGETLVTRAANEIQQVSGQVDEASRLIEGLVERSRQIGGIANVIKEIADQTNLLALNAAIEAARAGEQGRGFAVVADEVRKLAERTAQATDQINGMIQGIHGDTSSVVASMQAVTPQVAKGVEMAERAAASLRQINTGAQSTLTKIREVAHSTAEQSLASNNIAANVERIAQMVEESAVSVKVANDNVQALEGLAMELRSSVSQFRLD